MLDGSHLQSRDYGKACKCSFLYLVLSDVRSEFRHYHYDCVEKPLSFPHWMSLSWYVPSFTCDDQILLYLGEIIINGNVFLDHSKSGDWDNTSDKYILIFAVLVVRIDPRNP